MTATYQQPNFTTQTAAEYKASIDGAFHVHHRPAGAFAAHEASPPDMTVVVDAGAVMSGGSLTEAAQQVTGTISAPASNPRIDRIVIDASSGVVSVVTGVEAASPSAPAIPAGKLPVARVLLQTSSLDIVNSMITDERVMHYTQEAAFPSGTRMLFNQTAAPTGWTKDTTAALNNSALRIVTGAVGSGGSVAFTTAFASKAVSGSIGNTAADGTVGATTLTTAQIPSHSHVQKTASTGSGAAVNALANVVNATIQTSTISTAAEGGGGSHTHTFAGTAHNHTFTGTDINLAVKYNDVIIASKD